MSPAWIVSLPAPTRMIGKERVARLKYIVVAETWERACEIIAAQHSISDPATLLVRGVDAGWFRQLLEIDEL